MKAVEDADLMAARPLTEELLAEISARILRAFSPTRVILFGSYAEGRATADSDIDLLVVTEQTAKPRELLAQTRHLFCDMPLPVQVVTISLRDFQETQDVIGGIAYPATRYGSFIYEKS